MEATFLSVVLVLESPEDRLTIVKRLPGIHQLVAARFQDFEYVLINNCPELKLSEEFSALPVELKPYLYLINLSSRTDRNHAWLAGLDRSNGDYTVLLENEMTDRPAFIEELFRKSQEGFDIVYLRAPNRSGRSLGFFHRFFHWIIKRYSQLNVDPLAHNSRLISRRALNGLLRLRENLPYLKAAYSIVGFTSVALETDRKLTNTPGFGERFQAGLQTISSYTSFLRVLMGWIFLASFAFLLTVVTNALLVRYLGVDIFGEPVEAASGWTYLVVLIGVFFATTSLQLYLTSIYLGNIYQEVKRRPLYNIESIKRF
jgi:dolichol-phosphate mannosyltransferase